MPRFPLSEWSIPLNTCSKVFITGLSRRTRATPITPFMLKLTPRDEGTFKRLLHVTVSDHPDTASTEIPATFLEEAELISRGLRYVRRPQCCRLISCLAPRLVDLNGRRISSPSGMSPTPGYASFPRSAPVDCTEY